MIVSRNGLPLGSFKRCGRRAWWPTTTFTGSTGPGWAWTGAWPKHPSGGKKTGKNPTDRAKKGVKRSLLVDAEGIPLGLAVEGANRPDGKMAEATLNSIPVERPEATPEDPQGLCLDKAYVGDEIADLAQEFQFTLHIPPKGQDAQQVKRQAGAKARRWVVERTHSWMNRFRGILIRWNKKPENYMAMLHMAFAFIIYKKMELFG
jgi:putative transposase